jgi:DNA-binding LacI/PurR family transcriptional regulator
MGFVAGEILLGRMAGNSGQFQSERSVEPDLIVRESTAGVA